MLKSYKNIQYEYFPGKGKDLILILPSAGTKNGDLGELVTGLVKMGQVLKICRGYYGLEYYDKNRDFDKHNMSNFSKNLTELVDIFEFKTLIIVASSVGTIHALNFYKVYDKKFKIKALIFGAAALPLDKTLGNLATFWALNLLLLLPFGASFMYRSVVGYINNKSDKDLSVLLDMERRLGIKNYALCLKEIFVYCFGNRQFIISTLDRIGYLIVGDKDLTYKYWVNARNFKNKKYINAGHDILQAAPKEFLELIRGIFRKA